jgi:hypothetical protein
MSQNSILLEAPTKELRLARELKKMAMREERMGHGVQDEVLVGGRFMQGAWLLRRKA